MLIRNSSLWWTQTMKNHKIWNSEKKYCFGQSEQYFCGAKINVALCCSVRPGFFFDIYSFVVFRSLILRRFIIFLHFVEQHVQDCNTKWNSMHQDQSAQLDSVRNKRMQNFRIFPNYLSFDDFDILWKNSLIFKFFSNDN